MKEWMDDRLSMSYSALLQGLLLTGPCISHPTSSFMETRVSSPTQVLTPIPSSLRPTWKSCFSCRSPPSQGDTLSFPSGRHLVLPPPFPPGRHLALHLPITFTSHQGSSLSIFHRPWFSPVTFIPSHSHRHSSVSSPDRRRCPPADGC